jgi:hypothetical protein
MEAFCLDGAHLFDIFKRLVPVDMWFSGAEKVEIWAIDDQDEFLSVLHITILLDFSVLFDEFASYSAIFRTSEEVSWRIA